MFEKTKGRVDTLINDRVVAPVRTAVVISISALIVAGIALVIAVGSHSANR